MGQWGAGTTARGGSGARGAARLAVALLGGILASLLAALALGVPAALADDPSSTLHIVLPTPNGDLAEGPVGAYISFNGTGAANDTYQLGYATKDTQCKDGFTQVSDSATIQADGSGNLAATFVWPGAANAVGTEYYLCAKDTTTGSPILQSTGRYKVDGSAAPAMSLQAASATTPTPGAAPPPAGRFYAGEAITISGQNFLPSGTRILAYLGLSDHITAQTLQNGSQPLNTLDKSPIMVGDGGAFTATVAIPNETGQFYVQVVSADATQNLPPSLEVVKKIAIVLEPTPTPTPTATPTPTPTPNPRAGQTASHSGPGSHTALIATLGGASVVLFVAGMLLLASTASPTASRTAPGARRRTTFP